MIRILLAVFVTTARCQLAPLIYAAPSAVSHQSRIDIKHSPGFISAPLIYSPAIFASHPREVTHEAVLTPVLATDTILTPIALSFFNNLPLARALKHPISIKMMQEKVENDERNISDGQPIPEKEHPTDEVIYVVKGVENSVGDDQELSVTNNDNTTIEPREKLILEEQS